MLNTQLRLIVALSILAVGLSTGCGDKKKDKASCKKLVEQISSCGQNVGLSGDRDERVEDCKKKTKAGDKIVVDAVKCSKHNQCTPFEKCMKSITERLEAEREAKQLQKSFDEAKAKLKEGKHYSAKYFCKNTEKLPPDMKKWCGNLGRVITETMTAKLLKARDSLKVTYKDTSECDTMLSYAIKVSKKAGDDAGKLCQELKAAKAFASLKKQVEEQLKKDRPYFTWNCELKKLKEMTDVKTPYSQKLRKQLIALCFNKLGKKILAMRVPKMRYFCSVKKIYAGFKELKPTDPEIVKLMEQAAEKCEPKAKK